MIFSDDFYVQIFATFIGAALAFFFGFILYKIQTREQHIILLKYLISSLTSLSNNLYSLKEQIVQHRYKECLECESIIQTKKFPKLKIEHMSKYIFCGNFEWPIEQEKLNFLSSPDPNVVVLAGVLNGSIKTLNAVITDINEDTNSYIRGKKIPDNQDILMMIIKNKILYDQLDSTLYLTTLLIDVLIKFGKIRYSNNFEIKSIELTEEKYKTLTPQTIDSWDSREWFPRKERWWNTKWRALMARLRTNCSRF